MFTELRKNLEPKWIASCAAIAAVSAFVRFFWLELKPLHHDEGVNGFFLEILYNDGVYKYDPTNYHGPDLYYIALAFSKLFGLNTISVRMSVAVFGFLTVLLVFFLRKYIGTVGTLTAALLVALSPGMVYVSRYFIHEMLFVFLSLAIVVSIVLFIDREKAGFFATGWMILLFLVAFVPTTLRLAGLIGADNPVVFWVAASFLTLIDLALIGLLVRTLLEWNGGRPIYLLLASASVVLLFATKETGFITIGTMAIACGCVAAWRKIGPGVFGKKPEDEATSPLTLGNFKSALGKGGDRNWTIILAIAVFAYLGVLFFSSFFTHPKGILDAFRAYFFWTKTGTGDHTINGFFAYFKWALKIETAILLLSGVGAAIALVRGTNRFATFTSLWGFGMIAAYTIIPYKTPWLALSFILPMCIIAGYAVGEMFKSKNHLSRLLGGVLGLAAAVSLSYQTYTLNFVKYDDESMPYVYAHTRRGFLDLVGRIESVAEKSGKGLDTRVEIVSSDYWPLPWYLRDYSAAIFHGKFVESNRTDLIVAKVGDKEEELIRRYGSEYRLAGRYPLRPGVDLYLLVRANLAAPTDMPLTSILKK